MSTNTEHYFTPSNRGSIVSLENKLPSRFSIVAPESPRPQELLSKVSVSECGSKLTLLDQACHEILLSKAFEVDKEMANEKYQINIRSLARFLGTDVRKEHIFSSMNRLMLVKVDFQSTTDLSRSYKRVRLIDSWEENAHGETVIGYSFPAPIRELMRLMPKYAYIELSAIAGSSMSNKWAPALYKHLLWQSKSKEWKSGEDNDIVVKITPDELVEIVSFSQVDGKYNKSKLTEMVTSTVKDLEAVGRFSTKFDPIEDVVVSKARGRPILYYNFRLRLNPPKPSTVRIRGKYTAPGIGVRDDEKYQVSSTIWVRAVKVFNHRSSFSGYGPNDFRDIWLIALSEALRGEAVVDGYDTQMYRGEGLIQAIDDFGVGEAVWRFLGEQDYSPKMVYHLSWTTKLKAHVDRADRMKLEAPLLRKRHKYAVESDEKMAALRKKQEDEKNNPSNAIVSCKKAVLHIREMNELELDNEIMKPLDDMKWTGDKTILIKVMCHGKSHPIKARPTLNEWNNFIRDFREFFEREVEYS